MNSVNVQSGCDATCTIRKQKMDFAKQRKEFWETFLSDPNPLKCETCKKFFSTPANRKRHMQRMLHCKNCVFYCRTKTRLKFHMEYFHQIRNKEYHACAHCSWPFARRYKLIRHVEEVHKGKKSFGCYICGKQFSRMSTVNRHVRSIHNNNKWIIYISGLSIFSVSYFSSLRRKSKVHSYMCSLFATLAVCTARNK